MLLYNVCLSFLFSGTFGLSSLLLGTRLAVIFTRRSYPCQCRQSTSSLANRPFATAHLSIFRLIAHHAHRPGGYPYPVCGTKMLRLRDPEGALQIGASQQWGQRG